MWQSDRLVRRSTVRLVSTASASYGSRVGYVIPAAISQHLHWLSRRVRGRHPQIAPFSLYMLCAKLRTATDPQHMRLEMNFETSTLHSLVRRLSDRYQGIRDFLQPSLQMLLVGSTEVPLLRLQVRACWASSEGAAAAEEGELLRSRAASSMCAFFLLVGGSGLEELPHCSSFLKWHGRPSSRT